MSVENFCNKYPESADVAEIIEGIKTREFGEGKSSVVILAEQLVREGRDGIREILNKINPGNTMFEIDPRDFQQIPPEDRSKMFDDYAAIIFGISVVSLEKTLLTRKYDHGDWCERYNVATQGAQLSEAHADATGQKLSQEQMNAMYSAVRQDKTFSLFFKEEGIQAMPAKMRGVLEEIQILPIVRKSILPFFEARAKFVTASS